MLVIILAVVLLPVVFNVIYDRGSRTESAAARSSRVGAAGKTSGSRSFFEIPYITWFILHVMIAAVGTLWVVALALAGALDKATTASPAGTAGQTVDVTVVFADGGQIVHPQAFQCD